MECVKPSNRNDSPNNSSDLGLNSKVNLKSTMAFRHDFVLKLREQLQKSWLEKWEKLHGGQQFLKIQEVGPRFIIGGALHGFTKKIHGHLDECIISV